MSLIVGTLIFFCSLCSDQPPNDPHGITQQDLILALRAVLTGTARFAEVCHQSPQSAALNLC